MIKCWIGCNLFFKFVYLKCKASEREGGRQRRRSSICLFTPQMASMAGTGLHWSPGPGTIRVFHMGGRDPSALAIIHSLPRCINRKLDWKWKRWDLNKLSHKGCWCHKQWLDPLYCNGPYAKVILKSTLKNEKVSKVDFNTKTLSWLSWDYPLRQETFHNDKRTN